MKKLIILIGLLMPILVYSQSKKVTALDYDNVVDTNDIFYSIHQGATSKQMRADTLLNAMQDSVEALQSVMNDSLALHIGFINAGSTAFSVSGDVISLASSDDTLSLGVGTPAEKLDVLDNIRARNNLYCEDTFRLGSRSDAYLYGRPSMYTGGSYNTTLYLKDASGTYTLSTLGGAGVSSGSGITIDGSNNVNLGGTLTESAFIGVGAYPLSIYNTSGGYDNNIMLQGSSLWNLASTNYIKGYNNIYISGGGTASDSVKLYYESNLFRFRDYRTGSNIRGLEYFADYSATLKVNDRSIPDVGTVNELIADGAEIGTITFGGDSLWGTGDTVFINDKLKVLNQISFADGDNYIKGANDALAIYKNDALALNISGGDFDFYQDVNPNGYVSLGSSGEHWNRAYIDTIYMDADNDSRITTSGDDSIIVAPGGTTALTMELKSGKITTTAHDTLKIDGDGVLIIGDSTFVDSDFDFSGGSGTPGGDANDIQYNNAGSFGGFGDWDGERISFPSATGTGNYLIGYTAGNNIGAGSEYNLMIGYLAGGGSGSTSGDRNIVIGKKAGFSLSTADNNIFIGDSAGYATTTSGGQIFIGSQAGGSTSTGTNNLFIGTEAGFNNASGIGNLGIGSFALQDNFAGDYNIAIGRNAANNCTGNNNVVIGYGAGDGLISDDGCIFIGYQAGYNETNGNTLYIENSSSATPLIYGEFDNDWLLFNVDSLGLSITPSDTCALILTPSGKIDTAELGEVADYVFNMDIGEFEDYRIYWDENHRLKDILVSGNPYKYINSTVAALEKNFIWDARLRKTIRSQQKEIDRLNRDNEMLKEQMSRVIERLDALEKCHCIKEFGIEQYYERPNGLYNIEPNYNE